MNIQCFDSVNVKISTIFEKKIVVHIHIIFESLLKLVRVNQNLERLDLVKWAANEKLIVDIIRQAKKLKVLHLHKCGVHATKSLILQLVQERKTTLLQSGKLQLFFDKGEKNDLIAVQETDVTKCSDIKWNCDHDYLREAEIDEKDEEEETDEEDASDSDDNF